MKTNYQRRFVDRGSFRDRSMEAWSSRESGAAASIGNDFTNGHRGHARAVSGAKKFIRSRDRAHHKRETVEMLREYEGSR